MTNGAAGGAAGGAGVEKFWKNISVTSNKLGVLRVAVLGPVLARTVAVEDERVVFLIRSSVLPVVPGLIKSKRDPVEVLPDSVVVSPARCCMFLTPMLRLLEGEGVVMETVTSTSSRTGSWGRRSTLVVVVVVVVVAGVSVLTLGALVHSPYLTTETFSPLRRGGCVV